jgi:hypothetical protein
MAFPEKHRDRFDKFHRIDSLAQDKRIDVGFCRIEDVYKIQSVPEALA